MKSICCGAFSADYARRRVQGSNFPEDRIVLTDYARGELFIQGQACGKTDARIDVTKRQNPRRVGVQEK